MIKPNFSENQLQHFLNSEIYQYLFKNFNFRAFPIIPNLREEMFLGWDTGFDFPNLPHPQLEQKGCNFFIQYKLSNIYTTGGATGWGFWKKPFFRFELGYKRKGKWDFAQRDQLIKLVNEGYSVFYATNHVDNFDHLCEIAIRDSLISELPFLEVNSDLSKHTYVSFTNISTYFVLSSKPEKKKKVYLDKIHETLTETNIHSDFEIITKFILEFENSLKFKESSFLKLFKTVDHIKENKFLKFLILSFFLQRYFNLFWLRFPKREI